VLASVSAAYVAQVLGNDSVSVIDTATNTVIDTIPVGGSPSNITFSPNGQFSYIAVRNLGVVVIRTSDRAIVTTITGFSDPFGVDVTPDGNSLYVTDLGSDSVAVVNTNTNQIIDTITQGIFGTPGSSGRFIADAPLPVSEPIPTLSEWGVITLAALFGIAGFVAIRRKSALQF